jgi:hypothetical protein
MTQRKITHGYPREMTDNGGPSGWDGPENFAWFDNEIDDRWQCFGLSNDTNKDDPWIHSNTDTIRKWLKEGRFRAYRFGEVQHWANRISIQYLYVKRGTACHKAVREWFEMKQDGPLDEDLYSEYQYAAYVETVKDAAWLVDNQRYDLTDEQASAIIGWWGENDWHDFDYNGDDWWPGDDDLLPPMRALGIAADEDGVDYRDKEGTYPGYVPHETQTELPL